MASERTGGNLVYAWQLFAIGRFREAAEKFHAHLLENPNDGHTLAYLSLCHTRLEEYDLATEHAHAAIGLSPDADMPHYALACVLLERNHLKEARQAISEAIRIAPHDPDHHALQAAIEVKQGHWQLGLNAANQGLAIDPEHENCLNFRSLCLIQLGRREEAAETIGGALANSPDNAWTHANHGWSELHNNRPHAAMEHFREALRLDPESEFARSGIVEAMKARNMIYRVMLAYFLWMGRLSPQMRGGVLFLSLFLPQLFNGVGKAWPQITAYTNTIRVLLFAFVLLTWIAQPLFNLVLWFDSFGRLALSRDEKRGALLLACLLFPAIAFGLASIPAQPPWWLLCIGTGIILLILIYPAAMLYRFREDGWPKTTMWWYFGVLVAIAVLEFFAICMGTMHEYLKIESLPWLLVVPPMLLANALMWPFLLSPLFGSFLINWLLTRRVRR